MLSRKISFLVVLAHGRRPDSNRSTQKPEDLLEHADDSFGSRHDRVYSVYLLQCRAITR